MMWDALAPLLGILVGFPLGMAIAARLEGDL